MNRKLSEQLSIGGIGGNNDYADDDNNDYADDASYD